MNIVDRIDAVKAQMTNHNLGFECPNGWQELVATTHEAIIQIDPHYKIDQIKVKFGGLRFYCAFTPGLPAHLAAEISRIINTAEHKSFTICAVCGNPGALTSDHSTMVRCEMHRDLKRTQSWV